MPRQGVDECHAVSTMYVLYVASSFFAVNVRCIKLLHCEYEHAPEPTVTVKRSIRTPQDTNHGMKSTETVYW